MIFFRKQPKQRMHKIIKIIFVLSFVFGSSFSNTAYATYPVISDVGSSVTTVSATITWTTDINSSSLVDYGATTSYGNTRGDSNASVTDHSVNIDGLSPDTPYKFRVRSSDSNGDQTIDDNGGAGYSFTTDPSPVISNVRIAEITNSSVTITWTTNVNVYPYVAYGNTSSYGMLVGDEETLGTSHSMTIAGFSAGAVKHYRPRVKDIYGNFTSYGSDSTFTIGAPYLTSFSTTTPYGTYGPSDNINITANYTDSNGDNLGVGSSAVVLLDTGIQVTLSTVGTNTLSGTYTVGSTGSGENSTDLKVSSIVSQSVCDSNNYCHTGLTMPSSNISDTSDIYVDTIAPVFSSVQPASSAIINSVTNSSDIFYTLSEGLGSGTIKMTRTGGSSDGSSPHTCTLTGTALNIGAHNNFDTTNCSEGAVALVDGTIYTFEFDGEDPAGNLASQISRTGITFDTTSAQLNSFTSSTADGTYGPTQNINITATYDENLGVGSSISVALDTGVSVNLNSIVAGSSLTGTYTIGATGSGQNSSDLTVSSINGQSVFDVAGNIQSGTSLPGVNVANGSNIIIDTVAPSNPTLVQFITDPIKESNKYNVTLRVDGESNSTILYSIDDTNPGTDPVVSSSPMESDGSTDVAGINVAGLDDGTLTATVRIRDAGQNLSGSETDTVTKDTTGPTFSIQYYSDSGLSNSLGNNPHLKEGTYYMKISANESLVSTPTINIAAQGTGNDVTGGTTELVSGNDYRYTRNIIYDAAANGTGLENISITGTDNFENISSNVDPTDEASKAAYTDTIKPSISVGNVSPDNAKAGTVNITLTFNEPMDQTELITAVITKSDSSDLIVSGDYTDATHWSGAATVSAGDANGTATLKISDAKDLAENSMDANNNVDTFIIDTTNPTFQINDGTSATLVKSDTINIGVGDTGGSGLASQYYGFSSDGTCNAGDTIDNAFSSGVDFSITGDHTTDYLCVLASDNATNTTYQLVGALHVDNTAPVISSVNSTHADGYFKEGESITVGFYFSENVISAGTVPVIFDSGGSCSFTISSTNSASCDYVVGAGQNSNDLTVQSITGVIRDEATNDMVNFTPVNNLGSYKDIVIDTAAPVITITSPTVGVRVKDDAVISFTDGEIQTPQCSIDGSNWISCVSSTTKMSDLTGWGSLPEGNFTLYMRDTDLAGNIGTTNEGLIKDNTAPTIVYITSDTVDGYYKNGDVIDIDVHFSEAITSSGNITVTLDTGGSCSFSVTNYGFGTCNYQVSSGESSNDLNNTNISGTVYDQAGNPMTNFVPTGNDLADEKDIIVDTNAPTISNVTSPKANGTYYVSENIGIGVTFSEAVTSTGYVTVTLDSGGSCTFTITNSNSGYCDYLVLDGQNSADLNVSNISGVIKDQAGNQINNFVPTVNLADNKDIQIDTTNPGRPTITNVTSDHANGLFKAGEVIDIDFTFSESVNSTGYIGVTLSSGGSCTFTVTGSDTASCNYTVLSGENATDLNIDLVSGTIKDLAGNAMTNFAPVVNLVSNKDINIDTTPPNAPSVAMTDPITDANKDNIEITGVGELGASIYYSIDDTNSGTTPVTGVGAINEFGTYTISGINLSSLDSGNVTASVYLTDVAGNQSLPGTYTSNSQVIRPTITSIDSDHSNGSFGVGEVIDIDLAFSEYVTSTGNVTVTLETGATDRSCVFTVTNSNIGSCFYTVQTGDISSDLSVNNVAGDIRSQSGVTMINFTPSTNLEANKNIAIDTTAPSAPVITLLDPITDANKTAVTITGTGEANASISYSIDDTKSFTSPVTGIGSVDPGGNINLSGIDLSSLDGGVITATVYLSDTAGNQSLPGTDTATSQVVRPEVSSASSDHADGSFRAGEIIDIDITFSEPVTSGEVTVTLETGATDRFCTFSISNSTTGSCDYTVQSGDVSSDLTVASITGTITNADGNTLANPFPITNLAANNQIIVDTIAPNLVSFTSSTADGIYGPAQNINITANYNETISGSPLMSASLDTGASVSLSTIADNTKLTAIYSVGATGSGENTNDLAVSLISSQNVCDLAGNCQSSTSLPSSNISDTSEISVDTNAPEYLNILPSSSGNLNSVTASSDLYYSLSEDLASGTITFERTAWSEDPGSPHVCILQGNYLQQGDHDRFDTTNCVGGEISLVVGSMYTITYEAEDLYGNISTGQTRTGITFGMDSDGPAISDVTVSALDSSSATITWTTDENSSSLVDFGEDLTYGRTEGNLEDSVMNHSVTIRNLNPGETYYFRVRSADLNHQETIDDNGGSGYSFTTHAIATITNVEVGGITDTSATVTWNSDVSAYSYINYGVTESYGVIIGKEDAVTQNHTITMAGLSPSTTYYFRARIKDISGNYSLGSSGSFTTLAAGEEGSGEDDQAPSISSIKANDGDNGAMVISWKTNKDCNGMVRFGLDKDYGQSAGEDATIYAADEFSTKHEVILSELLSNTTYHFAVISYDASGNIAVSGDKTFKTPALSSISSVKVTDTTLNSATIVWETADPSTSTVDYGLTEAYGKQVKNSSLENMHKVELTGLEAGITYHFRVNAQNKDNTSISSDDYIFATIPRPVMGNYIIGEVTDSKITLEWTTNVETDSMVNFISKDNSENKGEQGNPDYVTNHKITLAGLDEGTAYDIRIKGTDANKNSFESDLFSVTTYKDETPPEISQINTESSLIGGKDDKVQSIIYWKTSEVATSKVVFDTKKSGDFGAYSQSSKEDANLSTNHVVVLTNLNSGTVYYFMVESKDKNGNESHSEAFSLLTPRKEKSIIQMIIANFEETFGWMKKMKK